jgi:hypothetical protein
MKVLVVVESRGDVTLSEKAESLLEIPMTGMW